ncbi:hypothetical protein [Bacillus sp. FJAT-45066]|uniref:hypothetical protein n=1 Tax=Bacillus sp. FJAT-45066 TaxID=2011010 RepID=UPI000BB7D6B3|nr:hypothetical protein [Bacillus sp. FJAT-45066]
MRKCLCTIIFLLITTGCAQQQGTNNPPDPNSLPYTTGQPAKLQPAAEIKKVTITCLSICRERYPNQPISQTFEDQNDIQLFVDALSKAIEIAGTLNYAANYEMTFLYEHHLPESFHLNLDHHDKTSDGLLVNLSNTETGYTIPAEHASKLSKLVFK